MTDITIVISERTAARLDCLLDTIEANVQFSATEHDTIDTLRYALTEARNSNELKDKIRNATDEGEGPPPGDAYWEA